MNETNTTSLINAVNMRLNAIGPERYEEDMAMWNDVTRSQASTKLTAIQEGELRATEYRNLKDVLAELILSPQEAFNNANPPSMVLVRFNDGEEDLITYLNTSILLPDFNIVTPQSAFGMSILGHTIGDIVSWQTSVGTITAEILSIS